MIKRHFIRGGLWEADVLALKLDKNVKNLNVSLEIDGHHLKAEYDLLITCESCGDTDSITMTVGRESHCREYECHACQRRWVDNFDLQISMVPGGKEILGKFNSEVKSNE